VFGRDNKKAYSENGIYAGGENFDIGLTPALSKGEGGMV
jgi:hypothetical protein